MSPRQADHRGARLTGPSELWPTERVLRGCPLGGTAPSRAQGLEAVGPVRPGTYTAGDRVKSAAGSRGAGREADGASQQQLRAARR